MALSKKYISSLISVIILLISQIACAQDTTETVIFRAMKDELDRSMSKLVYKDYQKPFFISYTIDDVQTIFSSASLGSISNSNEKHYRTWGNRVMVGNYQLNDENFSDATRRKPSRDGDLDLPLDNDYFGIRRALWMMTNNTYKSAAETYRNKLESLKDKNLNEKDLQIPDFSQAPVLKLSSSDENFKWDKNYVDNLVKEVSLAFKDFPSIFYSEVTVFQMKANIYFYSSEGSQIKAPLNIAYLYISGIYQTNDGDNLTDQVRYCAMKTEDLPDAKTLIADAHSLAQNLIDKGNAEILTENYSGPVLFQGQAVAEALSQGMFSGTDNLFAYREPLYNSSQKTMYYGNNINSLESKLNKLVAFKNLTIKDLSGLKSYKGINLVGSYTSDGEGVKPADTLVLIENGILKNLYNGRTPTRNIKSSNGHNRYMLNNGAVTTDLGPGVLFVSSNEGKSLADLKQDLIKTAKEEGLDYAIIIRPIKQGNFYMPLNIYKVYVNDGREVLLREITMKAIDINSLKKIFGTSSSSLIYNTLVASFGEDEESGNVFNNQGSIPSGVPVSYIIPDAILMRDVEFDHQTKPLSSDRPVVKSPLLIGK